MKIIPENINFKILKCYNVEARKRVDTPARHGVLGGSNRKLPPRKHELTTWHLALLTSLWLAELRVTAEHADGSQLEEGHFTIINHAPDNPLPIPFSGRKYVKAMPHVHTHLRRARTESIHFANVCVETMGLPLPPTLLSYCLAPEYFIYPSRSNKQDNTLALISSTRVTCQPSPTKGKTVQVMDKASKDPRCVTQHARSLSGAVTSRGIQGTQETFTAISNSDNSLQHCRGSQPPQVDRSKTSVRLSCAYCHKKTNLKLRTPEMLAIAQQILEGVSGHCRDLNASFYGLTLNNLRRLAFDTIKSHNWPLTFMKKKNSWSLRTPQKTSPARIVGFNTVQLDVFFNPPSEDWIMCNDCKEWWHKVSSAYGGRGTYLYVISVQYVLKMGGGDLPMRARDRTLGVVILSGREGYPPQRSQEFLGGRGDNRPTANQMATSSFPRDNALICCDNRNRLGLQQQYYEMEKGGGGQDRHVRITPRWAAGLCALFSLSTWEWGKLLVAAQDEKSSACGAGREVECMRRRTRSRVHAAQDEKSSACGAGREVECMQRTAGSMRRPRYFKRPTSPGDDRPCTGPSSFHLKLLSVFEVVKRGSDKGDTATRFKCAIATKRKALN
ncbi:hypothetical protein PR048_022381 [Dryococelus australis]|uniref:Uncharacterized protein n=1 Tax=Dryococelus australis TaxID=614101 RepID=A0ABQ9H0W4_9NEOP|nr:hypothetical protein PR048_022381 [Dryococelus australis]